MKTPQGSIYESERCVSYEIDQAEVTASTRHNGIGGDIPDIVSDDAEGSQRCGR